jgi:hypothetical protein
MPAEACATAVRHVFRARFLRLRRRTTDGRTDERTDGMSGFALLSAHPESGLIPHAATARPARLPPLPTIAAPARSLLEFASSKRK